MLNGRTTNVTKKVIANVFTDASTKQTTTTGQPVPFNIIVSCALTTWSCCLFLGGNPGVFQTLSSCGPFLWLQFQHGEEKRTELESFLPWPLVFIQQDLQQTPWFQFCDVPQLSWGEETEISGCLDQLAYMLFHHKALVPKVIAISVRDVVDNHYI